MLLQMNKMTLHYGPAEILSNICLDVPIGHVVSIIGSNGAGKSSVLKAITGLVPITEGDIQFDGRKINGLPTHEIVRQGIVLVPEGRRPFPFMSVLNNLKIGAYLQKDKSSVRMELEEIFTRFPVLLKRSQQAAGTLSGGEQQMLVIGRALMARPRLLLMDEPLLGLAPIVMERLAQVITEIQQEGISVLLVEQNATLVTRVSNSGYVLEGGEIVLKGNIKELMANELVQRAFLGT
jgi:branched-chain amino acid transport system ATP-binding protein